MRRERDYVHITLLFVWLKLEFHRSSTLDLLAVINIIKITSQSLNEY